MDDIKRYDFWHREMEEYLANIKKETEAKKQEEAGTFEYNDGI